MIKNVRLARIGGFELRLQHLLIIGILAAAFSISFMVRSQPADYGFELNEFDPFFNYRATQYLVENGPEAYFAWHDDMVWHPDGRNISDTSQTMLHFTAALTYHLFGGSSSVYDHTIIFPVVFGSLTTIIVFALVRVLGGTTAGLFASLFFAVSLPVIVRGTIGWFKSEPLGLFYGLLGVYLFLSGIRSEDKRVAAAKLAGGGVILAFGLSAWGGIQFFLLPIALFILALPIFRKDLGFLVWAVPLFAAALMLTASLFARPGINFVTGIGAFMILGPTAYMVVSAFVLRFTGEAKRMRNGLLLMAGTILAGILVLALNTVVRLVALPSFRYMNAINPFLTTEEPLVDSVAEHATTTTSQSFFFLSILMVFAAAGIWLIFTNRERLAGYLPRLRPDMVAFSLIIGMLGVYISSAFVRLELFASISVIILSSVGLSILASEVLRPPVRTKRSVRFMPRLGKISFVAAIVILLIIPVVVPLQGNWIASAKVPPTILNGGTVFGTTFTDWPDAMEWLRESTPEDAVVASWWDYGYWITTLANRTSLVDNATMSTDKIRAVAEILLDDPDGAWESLNEIGADYMLVFVAANGIQNDPVPLYLLTGGADESKKQWFIRIAEEPTSKYLHPDGISGTPHFWENTLLGQLIPYTLLTYVEPATNEQSETFVPGYTGVYAKTIKYPADGDGPFRLAYSSESFGRQPPGPVTAVLIYEVNKDYTPGQAPPQEIEIQVVPDAGDNARVSTTMGEFTIGLRDDLAPGTVENFRNLAGSGLYDGTIFHRIIPGFVIQGGDPNTVSGGRDTWGSGGPGHSIAPEFSGETHAKYAVSMARGAAIDSAGSQFFIVLDDSPWLDGQYTIFGHVTEGHDIVDLLAAVELDEEYTEQPRNASEVIIQSIRITG